MACRVLADLRHLRRDPSLEQPLLDQLFGVRVDGYLVPQPLQAPEALDQAPHVAKVSKFPRLPGETGILAALPHHDVAGRVGSDAPAVAFEHFVG